MTRPPFRAEVYPNIWLGRRRWSWRKVSKNGQRLAISMRTYQNRLDCLHGLELCTPGYCLAALTTGLFLVSEWAPESDPAYRIAVVIK